ncbi:hypothetical protein V9L13_12340 [Pseudomonas sp. RSB 5.4]|uniref:hypothetical protein n=1 Tax=Pseudomonas sp. RSB 5.4 TaxID=3127459 RepID=UPI0030D2DE8E
MLFVHGSLAMGGIETFYVRMAQARKEQGLATKIVLLSQESKSNKELVGKARECADVYFLEDFIQPVFAQSWSIFYQFSLLYPLRSEIVKEIVDSVESAHVSNGFCAHMVLRLASSVGRELPISIGLYHSMEFCWGRKLNRLPFFEKCNRDFFNMLHKHNALMFFNEKMVEFYFSMTGKDFSNVHVFPLGVIDQRKEAQPKIFSNCLKIGTVGRLVDFKTYNIWMLDVVDKIMDEGIEVSYDIYGEGPLKEKISERISELKLDAVIKLKGGFNYSEFSNVVAGFDIFVGSGTALIEASGLGVPAIVGIESITEAETYGFFSEIPGFSYNEDNLYPKKDVMNLLLDFYNSSEGEKALLSHAHIKKSEIFSMGACVENFSKVNGFAVLKSSLGNRQSWLFRILYTASVGTYSVRLKLAGKTLSQVVSSAE